MKEESRERIDALNNLFEEAFEEIDPAAESPLYGQLCSLHERYMTLLLWQCGHCGAI